MKQLKYIFIVLSFISLGIISCKKDFDNPNAAPQDDVFTSARGMTAAAVGLQRLYSYGRAGMLYNIVTANGFVTNELRILNTGNLPEAQLSTGGTTVDGTNTVLGNIWANASKIMLDADRILAAAPSLPDKGYASGLIGYASIYKAMAIGTLAMFWEKVPDTVGTNVTFSDRMAGYTRAIAVIDRALAAIATNPISTTFAGNIPAGTDIINTLYALKARYALFSGNYTLALATANLVDLTKRSTMNYDAVSINPIFETATSTNNVWQPVDSTFGLPIGLRPTATDKRVQFYTTINPTIAPRFRVGGFGLTSTTPWPYYVPGEIILIKAESYARMSPPDLANALIELNKVVTKQPTADPFGIGAGELPFTGATQAAILDEIYRQRQIELYMMGFKLEDMRRFGRPLTGERKRNFFPYPFTERDNNPNTPIDPLY
ncbi:MAG TPA: hypothetical protein VK489_09195 [Ferruginibacter sp.]|nr:hypothetical protein [Ferruginibacter sp.]